MAAAGTFSVYVAPPVCVVVVRVTTAPTTATAVTVTGATFVVLPRMAIVQAAGLACRLVTPELKVKTRLLGLGTRLRSVGEAVLCTTKAVLPLMRPRVALMLVT